MHGEHELLEDLRALGRVRSPAGLLERVIGELDLGDRYAALDSPLGRLFVAGNRLGISTVVRTVTSSIARAGQCARSAAATISVWRRARALPRVAIRICSPAMPQPPARTMANAARAAASVSSTSASPAPTWMQLPPGP